MKHPTPIVFYFPAGGIASTSDGRVDEAGLLERLRATDLASWDHERTTGRWGGVPVRASAELAGDLVRLVLELPDTTWHEIVGRHPDRGFLAPGRFRRLIDAFAAAVDELDCSIAFKYPHYKFDDSDWGEHYEAFDRWAAGPANTEELLRLGAQFGYASDRLDQLHWDDRASNGMIASFVFGFRTSGGTVWFDRNHPFVLPLDQRPHDRVFRAPAADGWTERWWGVLDRVHTVRTGRRDLRKRLGDYRDSTVGHEYREVIADYLRGGPAVLVASESQLDPLRCPLCGAAVPERLFQSDGVWWWPGYYPHLVRLHDYVVPNEMAAHILAAGGVPPEKSMLPIDDLPWPPPVNPGDPPWPHQQLRLANTGWWRHYPDGRVEPVEPDDLR